jgi:hypothetical protein
MEDVGIVCSRFVYLLAIRYILWPFGIFNCHLVYFSRFGMLYKEKYGNPGRMHLVLLASRITLHDELSLRNALKSEKYFFRNDIVPSQHPKLHLLTARVIT